MKQTATEILNEQITFPCYLCGKGTITMRAGDISINSRHEIDAKVKLELEKHLLKETNKFMHEYETRFYLYQSKRN